MQPPEAAALRARPGLRRQAWSRGPQPVLSNCCAIREGGRRQRRGAVLARRLLAWRVPVGALAPWGWPGR
ncbi:hypothetical protein C6568_04385 [Melaminivora suipulveris]|uniref:Uncharacterized protein n=1 Tax=Melaminivora suipulveris TaxID=2109913 RepID=A0A2R3QA06_9BURK|nr:hypothetical protein C6568_04385 [Melaminivora suipulveris]